MKKILFVLLLIGLNELVYASLTDGLIAHYDFEGNALDKSGNNLNGDATDVKYVNGIIGKSAEFNGVTSHITVPHDTKLNLHAITLSAWVFDFNHSGSSIILLKGKWNNTGDQKRQYGFMSSLNNTQIAELQMFNFEQNWERIKSKSDVPLNKWTHIVVTYDGESLKVYINGSLEDSKVISFTAFLPSTPEVLTIGAGRNDSGVVNLKNGLIDELRIYKRALSDSEILQLFNESNGQKLISADCNNDTSVNVLDVICVINTINSLQ